MNESLGTIVNNKLELEDFLHEFYGEVSEELEKLWEDSNIQLKDKLDNYGVVIKDLQMLIVTLKDKKKVQADKITSAINHLENEIKKMKSRLFKAGEDLNEQHLRGYNYSFHPYISKVVDSVDIELVEDKYKRYQLPKLNNSEYIVLMNALNYTNNYCEDTETSVKAGELESMFKNAKIDVLSSELPAGHPAVKYKLEQLVRIT